MKSLCTLLLALLLLPTTAFAEAPRSHLSADPRVNDARTLIEAGRFDEALSVLRPLVPDHPDRTDVLFLTGLAALRASQLSGTADEDKTALLDEAVAALRAILVERPGLVRVRLELAQAFFLMAEDDLAREHFERVLAGAPPPAMAANIRRYLREIRARRRWSARFGLALAPDSNLNAASDHDVIYIFGLPFRRGPEAGAKSGFGAIAWGGGEYQHPLGDRLRIRAGGDFSRREYAQKDFDQTYLSVHAGPRWLASPTTELSLLGSARRRLVAGESHSREHGVRFETEHRFTPRVTGRGRASWHEREYARSEAFDGPHRALSFGGMWLMTPAVRVDATVGYARERPESVTWRNARRWGRLGVSVALPHGFTVGAGAEVHLTDYDGRWGLFTPRGVPRADRLRLLSVSLFHRAFTVYGFSPQLVLVNEARDSNAQLHGYRRNRVELRIVWQV